MLTYILIIVSFYLIFMTIYNHDKYYYICETTRPSLKVNITYSDPTYFLDKNIIICGLARDIKKELPYIEQNLSTFTQNCKDHLILIVENDSKDGSRQLLLNLKNKFNIVLLGCDQDSPICVMNSQRYGHVKTKSRISKMVDIRNIYMDYINSLSPNLYDYVIMLDLDIMASVYKDGLHNTAYYLSRYPDIDMIGANSICLNVFRYFLNKKPYYDDYAMKPNIKTIDHTKKANGTPEDLIRVDSCFGGYVIYKFNSIYGKRYQYMEDSNGMPICEHVVFNQQLKSKFINPKMVFPVLKN